MESIGFMSVEILVAVATFVLTAVVSVWRINASHTKRLDQFSIHSMPGWMRRIAR